MRPANTEAETPYALGIMTPGTRFPARAYQPAFPVQLQAQ